MSNELSTFKDQLELIELYMNTQLQIDIPVEHTFSGGVYIRQITVPAGTIILGKRHRFASCNFLASGTILLYTGSSTPPSKMTGPLMFESEPMFRKLFYCKDEVTFMNIHPTNETDLEKIEEHFIISDEEYKQLNQGDQSCLG